MADEELQKVIPLIVEDGELMVNKKVLVEGDEGCLERGDVVVVHYVGKLMDGTVFDSTREREQPVTFVIGNGEVIKGLEIGVSSMNVNEMSLFTCHPRYAYGKFGCSPMIPPDSTIQFEVELISCQKKSEITEDQGIIKQIIKKSREDKTPIIGNEVSIHYVAKLSNGQIFDSSRDRNQKMTWILGESKNILPCFDITVQKMSVGDIWNITVQPQYAYGDKGNEEFGVSSNEVLTFEIELLEIFPITKIMDGVIKKTIREGDYPKPVDGATISVKLEGKDGNQNTFLSNSSTLILGSSDLPEAVESSLLTMDQGEIATIIVDSSEFCFSPEENKLKDIPTGKLTFDIELFEIENPKMISSLTSTEKLENGIKFKDQGNNYFKNGRYRQAQHKYLRGLLVLNSNSTFSIEQRKQVNEIKLSLHLNLAAVKLKLKSFNEAIEHCSKVLEIEESNVKGLFRRAQAKFNLGSLEEAKQDLLKAGNLSPQDKEIRSLLTNVNTKIKEKLEKSKKVYSAMFEQ